MRIEIGKGHLLSDWVTAWRAGDQDRFIVLADNCDIWVNMSDSFPTHTRGPMPRLR